MENRLKQKVRASSGGKRVVFLTLSGYAEKTSDVMAIAGVAHSLKR